MELEPLAVDSATSSDRTSPDMLRWHDDAPSHTKRLRRGSRSTHTSIDAEAEAYVAAAAAAAAAAAPPTTPAASAGDMLDFDGAGANGNSSPDRDPKMRRRAQNRAAAARSRARKVELVATLRNEVSNLGMRIAELEAANRHLEAENTALKYVVEGFKETTMRIPDPEV